MSVKITNSINDRLGNTNDRLNNTVRAWVNFNGTNGAIRAAGNVSSVTRNGVGDYTINFTTAMPDANYSVVGTCSQFSDGEHNTLRGLAIWGPNSYNSTSVRIRTMNGINTALIDPITVCIAIFR